MTVSALSGVFREYTLSYAVASGTSTDADGNPIETSSTSELVVTFDADTSAQVLLRDGADVQIVRGRGACINPALMPAAITPGTELDMTYGGRAGKLRVLQISDSPLEVLDEVLGQEFLAEWRAT